jgi:preprotein translocase subunit SecD
MKPFRTWLIVVAALCSAAVLGSGLWLMLRPQPPTLEQAGGTILIYEIDADASPVEYSPADMADALQRRIDPSKAKGMSVRSEGHDRFEIIIPRGPQHAEDVQHVKDLVERAGRLEFRILANSQDDRAGIEAVKKYFDELDDPALPEQDRAQRQQELELLAELGKPPRVPPGPGELEAGQPGYYEGAKGRCKYSWLELGTSERKALGLDSASEKTDQWQQAAKARRQNKVLTLGAFGETLLYSRGCVNRRLSKEDKQQKRFEYFILARDPLPGKEITGQYLANAKPDVDRSMQPCVNFTFNDKGGRLFYEITSDNLPTGSEASRFYRHLAIILDGQIMSAPRLVSAISSSGQITGNFTPKEVDTLVNLFRSGALPATLKPLPISETTVEPQR